MQKRLLIIAAGRLQIPVICKAREMGIYTIVADSRENAIGLTYADKAIITDVTNNENMLRIAKEEQINGVIHPCSEYAMNTMGYINDALHLSGLSEDVVHIATNKYHMRQAFEKYGVSSPKSFIVKSAEEAWNILKSILRSDAILKPLHSSGSRGVSMVKSDISKKDFFITYSQVIAESQETCLLLEQFINGNEFSVEAIVWQNKIHILAVTDKFTTGVPHFVEIGHSQPSTYPPHILNCVKASAIKGIEALQLNNCAVHAEIKVENNEAYVIEIGARLGGDYISTILTPISTGIDMTAAAINIALGIEPDLTPRKGTQAAVIRYFTPQPGKLHSIHGDEILKSNNILNAEIYCHIGSTIPEIKSSADRSGHVICTASTAQEALLISNNIVNNIHFEIDN